MGTSYNNLGRTIARLPLVLLGVLTAGVFGLAFWVDRFGQRDRAHPAQAIVVLGARVLPGGAPSAALAARVKQGVDLYRRGLAPLLVFTGGAEPHAPAEAEVMNALAVAAGVPASACLLETQSHTTAQNARYTARLLIPRSIREVILVSDPYHLLRAQRYFRREGFTALTSPALLAQRNFSPLDRLYWTLREAFALLTHPRLW